MAVGEDPIAARYADAFWAVVQPRDLTQEALEGLERLEGFLKADARLQDLLMNPQVELEAKLSLLGRLLERSWSTTLRAFAQLVLSMGRAEALPGIIEAFRRRADAERGRLRVLVRCARPLTASLRTALKRRLEGLQATTVELTEQVDPELIGGVQVLMQNRLFDGSLKTRLAELRHRLRSVRVHA